MASTHGPTPEEEAARRARDERVASTLREVGALVDRLQAVASELGETVSRLQEEQGSG